MSTILSILSIIPISVFIAVIALFWFTYKQAIEVVKRKGDTTDEEVDDIHDDVHEYEENFSRDVKTDLDDMYATIPECYIDQIADRERKESTNSSSSSGLGLRRRLRTDSQRAIEKVLTLLVNPIEKLKERTDSFNHALDVFSGKRRRRLSLYQMDGGSLNKSMPASARMFDRRNTQAVVW